MELKRLIAVARGRAPADLVLRDAWVVNTFAVGPDETYRHVPV